MTQTTMEQLLDRWLNDTAFRDELQRDPEATIRATEIALTDEDWQVLRAANYDLSDGALAERVAKPRARI